MAEDLGQELGWDQEEYSADEGFTVIPAGTYPFVVEKLERKRFEGSAKMASCPVAQVGLSVFMPDGSIASISDRIMLNTKTAWRVAGFFEGLGYPKNPETNKVRVNWEDIIGKQGYVKVKVRTYTTKNGDERESNDVDEYIKPENWPQQPAVAAPQVTQPQQQAMPINVPAAQPQYQRPGGYTTGAF